MYGKAYIVFVIYEFPSERVRRGEDLSWSSSPPIFM